MLQGMQHIHSSFRYVLLILLIAAIVNAFLKFRSKKAYGNVDDKLSLAAFVVSHFQLLVGMMLYVISPVVKSAWSMGMGEMMGSSLHRFYAIEHIFGMLVALALVTIGRIRAKKQSDDVQKHKTTFLFYLIALIIIIATIPWPFRNMGAAWF